MGDLTKCKICGKEVARQAPTCPHCGTNLPGIHAKCPNCGSMNIAAGTKGFSLKKAVGGAILLGPFGLLGGMVGRKKIEFACLDCGRRWAPRSIDYEEPREKLSAKAITAIINKHKDWLNDESKGECANLSRVDLSIYNVNLSGAKLAGAKFVGAKLEKAVLDSADLSKADLREANMIGTSCCKASFKSANLSKAVRWGSQLREANFEDAILEDVDLRGSNITGANFKGACLDGADFSNCKGKSSAKF